MRITVTNSILWGNDVAAFAPDNEETRFVVDHSNVQGLGDRWPSAGNIGSDPLFVERNDQTPWAGTWYLSHVAAGQANDSPCINAGGTTAALASLDMRSTRVDLVPDDSTVDMGFHIAVDCNEHDLPDWWDIAVNGDCNLNRVPDDCETPDECTCQPIRRDYTSSADFDEGTLINVNHDVEADELRLSVFPTPLNFLWVPVSGRGTVIRIDTATGTIVGEYLTGPDDTGCDPNQMPLSHGGNPSRTAVDLDGNLWVANRDTTAVQKIGFTRGGTRCDADGTPNSEGRYLKPPFEYNSCLDRDHDGLIKTSFGYGDVLCYLNYGVGEFGAEDECICQHLSVAPAYGPRHVSIDRSNDVWVGGWDSHTFVQIDGEKSEIIAGTDPDFDAGSGGYGGIIECDGTVWTVQRYDSIVKFSPPYTDFENDVTTITSMEDPYTLVPDLFTDDLLIAQWGDQGLALLDRTNAANPAFLATPAGISWRGVAVSPLDPDRIWVAASLGAATPSVYGFYRDSSGFDIVDLREDPEDLDDHSGDQPTGLAVDHDGNLWVTCLDGDSVKRVSFATEPPMVDLTIGVAPRSGDDPDLYSYSDQSGQVTLSTTGAGTWNAVHDSGKFGALWTVNWNNAPETSLDGLEVAVRASDELTGLPFAVYRIVDSGERGVRLSPHLRGRYVEVRTRFFGLCPEETPRLANLSVFDSTGDMNCDGIFNNFDIDPFVIAVTNQSETAAPQDWITLGLTQTCWDRRAEHGDANGDGTFTNFDLDPFVAFLTTGACNPGN
ncbi:MAG: hypothetical protein IPM64_15225 [Phycisphaerales bacterium]|nr:hypothetical protein [Phycisphaerales bacterium]